MSTATLTRRTLLATTAGLAAPAPAPARAELGPIRIGEINSYSAIPMFTLPYRNGWRLAVDEINAGGGVLGRQLLVIGGDDGGKPQDAVKLAHALLDQQKVDILAGGYSSNVGLALADFARERGCLYVAGEPLTDALVWDNGNRFCFRLRPSTYMQAAMLAEEAAKLPAKRWVTVAPDYEYGRSAVKWFRTLLTAARQDVAFVGEQWPGLGTIDAATVVGAMGEAKPDAIFNATFGPDLTNFVRLGKARGLFGPRPVVSLLTGEPEYLAALGDQAPEGWIVTGYPQEQVDTRANTRFVAAYRQRFDAVPDMGSVVGYSLLHSIAAGITRAAGLGVDKLIEGFGGVTFDTPFGPATYREADHQGTMGTFVGKTAVKDRKGVMVDWRYADGAAYLPTAQQVKALRTGG